MAKDTGILCPQCGAKSGATLVTVYPSRRHRETGTRMSFPEHCCTECDYRKRLT